MSSEEEMNANEYSDDEARVDEGNAAIEDTDEDTLRICIATDCHLGYAEGDAVRGNDSFAALEEIMYLAKHYGCDMVLLAGDLFHENKPSRRTMHKAMSVFRKYCMGPNPISIQILSDQAQNFRQGQVNYQSEFYSVDLPVMSIHGNHDDPSREGTELYAALDLLDCANLVNYIGRQDQINQIQIAPVLMKKGHTHLALYGLGSMRDERLNRMWQGSKLTFLRPEHEGDEDSPEFFNLFALHQNRDKGRGSKNCVHETMIPEWMDLVCWGHEHECCIEPQESVVGTFRITQPGSSVATSLVAGEAVRKQIGILDVRGQSFRLRPIPLTQVRSFVLGDISLQEQRRLDPDDPKVEQKIKQILKDQVDLLIHQAKEKRQELQDAAKGNSNILAGMEETPLSHVLEKPEEVLVRLKVEHSGFSALNNQRFGAQFIGQVANPTDILLFQRKKVAPTRNSNKVKDMKPIAPEELEEMNIEDLIVGELEQPERKLQLFDEKRMASALEDYVQKQQAQAIPEIINNLLGKQQKRLIQRGPKSSPASEKVEDKENELKVERAKERKRDRTEDTNEAHDDSDDGADVAMEEEEPPKRSKPSRSRAPPKQSRRRDHENSSLDEDDDRVMVVDKPSKRTVITARTRKAAVSYEESDEDDFIEEVPPPSKTRCSPRKQNRKKRTNYSVSDGDSVEDDIEASEDEKPPKRKTATTTSKPKSRSAVASSTPSRASSSQARLSQSQLSFAPTSGRKRSGRKQSRKSYGSDDEEVDETPTRSYDLDDDWGTAKTDTFG